MHIKASTPCFNLFPNRLQERGINKIMKQHSDTDSPTKRSHLVAASVVAWPEEGSVSARAGDSINIVIAVGCLAALVSPGGSGRVGG